MREDAERFRTKKDRRYVVTTVVYAPDMQEASNRARFGEIVTVQLADDHVIPPGQELGQTGF